MTTTTSIDTVHAIIPKPLKQSVREFCAENDLTESQLIRRAVQAMLNGKVQP